MLSCVYAFCTLCLSSFPHDDYACVLLCSFLSTYSAASSSSLRNFLTLKFLNDEFVKIAYSPPLVDLMHFHLCRIFSRSNDQKWLPEPNLAHCRLEYKNTVEQSKISEDCLVEIILNNKQCVRQKRSCLNKHLCLLIMSCHQIYGWSYWHPWNML